MRIREQKLPRMRELSRSGRELSREALVRLSWMDFYRTHGRNAALTCRHYGISRKTFYRGRRRFDPQDLHSLEGGSHRPHHRRQPPGDPRGPIRSPLGKDKLVLLGGQGLRLSTSMVGRILRDLKKRGVLIEPSRSSSRGPRRLLRPRPYAVRKPKEYRAIHPGDLVEIDTLDVRPLPGVIWKHFTARDVISRWDVLQAHRRATAATARQFLDSLQQRMPFPIRAVQVDGGSEFAAEFEQACQQRGLRLFVLPPRSPKLNGAVECAQRTHREEFYQVTGCSLKMAALNRELREWEKTYNTVRPHQSLSYPTPEQYLQQWHAHRKN
jgi:putative transposase